MTLQTVLVVTNCLSGLALFWTCVCRCLITSSKTAASIRFAIAFLGAAGFAGACAPFLWGAQVHWPGLLLMDAVLTLQIVTTRLWSDGVPHQFVKQQDERWPRVNRRG